LISKAAKQHEDLKRAKILREMRKQQEDDDVMTVSEKGSKSIDKKKSLEVSGVSSNENLKEFRNKKASNNLAKLLLGNPSKTREESLKNDKKENSKVNFDRMNSVETRHEPGRNVYPSSKSILKNSKQAAGPVVKPPTGGKLAPLDTSNQMQLQPYQPPEVPDSKVKKQIVRSKFVNKVDEMLDKELVFSPFIRLQYRKGATSRTAHHFEITDEQSWGRTRRRLGRCGWSRSARRRWRSDGTSSRTSCICLRRRPLASTSIW